MFHYLNTLTGDTSIEPTDRGWRVFTNFGTQYLIDKNAMLIDGLAKNRTQD
jgi:hypothetical protein